MMSPRLAVFMAVLATVLASLCGPSAGAGRAEASGPIPLVPAGGTLALQLPLNTSQVLALEKPASRVAVGNPEIADLVVIGPRQVYVLAKAIGSTNLLLWRGDDTLTGAVNLEVTHDLQGLKAKLHRLLPGEAIEVHSARSAIVLRGQASSVPVLEAAQRIAESYLPEPTAEGAARRRGPDSQGEPARVINLVEVGGSQQVMLSVKVAEVERTELKRLDARFNAVFSGADGAFGALSGGGTLEADGQFVPNPLNILNQGLFGVFLDRNFRLNLAIDAARENGLARILAEPTLTTLTGQEAEFLSGGEFPIPVPQGVAGNVTIEFKPFGVGLKFLPVVLSGDRINLKVNVSVSELDESASVVLENPDASLRTFVPSLRQRSATATVELRDGQTLGLAGLLDDTLRESVSRFPGLGSIPVLGALFRSNQYQQGQTELVILVTPRLAQPVREEAVSLPTDGFTPPSDYEFYLEGRLEGRPAARTGDGSP